MTQVSLSPITCSISSNDRSRGHSLTSRTMCASMGLNWEKICWIGYVAACQSFAFAHHPHEHSRVLLGDPAKRHFSSSSARPPRAQFGVPVRDPARSQVFGIKSLTFGAGFRASG